MCVQLIVTTHSPQVISTVCAASIRIIDPDGAVRTPQQETRGVESSALLAEVMSVDPVPRVEQARWVAGYQALVEQGEGGSEGALLLRDQIIQHFGARHPVTLDCDRLLRWQAFKLRRKEGTG